MQLWLVCHPRPDPPALATMVIIILQKQLLGNPSCLELSTPLAALDNSNISVCGSYCDSHDTQDAHGSRSVSQLL